jgi:hypothetical protein
MLRSFPRKLQRGGLTLPILISTLPLTSHPVIQPPGSPWCASVPTDAGESSPFDSGPAAKTLVFILSFFLSFFLTRLSTQLIPCSPTQLRLELKVQVPQVESQLIGSTSRTRNSKFRGMCMASKPTLFRFEAGWVNWCSSLSSPL